MTPEQLQADATATLPAPAGTPAADGAASLPIRIGAGVPRLAGRLRTAVARDPRFGRAALVTMALVALAVVALATDAPSVLVPRSTVGFPSWMSGPAHSLLAGANLDADTLSIILTVAAGVMLVAYLVALASARALSGREIAIAVVALHLVMLMSPPLQLTDVFNYLGYARLGALHGLNPYTHVIAEVSRDPVYRYSTWHHLRSPYGPAFTALSYPLAFLPLSVAYWLVKTAVIGASLALIAIVWRCARQLGRDARFAVLFLAGNPILVLYALGGFHNDFFMLVPLMGSVSLLLARRDRSAGAVLMLAVAMKFTAVLLLPFLLLAARPSRRRVHLLSGAALAAIPLIAGDIALFGLAIPNLSDQSSLLTGFSIPNLVGLLIGIGGGTPGLLRIANVALVLSIALLIRRRGDWLTGAGWATVALIASLAWLMPWYVTWLLPLAGLATSARLRVAALVMSAFLLVSFVPATGMILGQLQINPLSGAAGVASMQRQQTLD